MFMQCTVYLLGYGQSCNDVGMGEEHMTKYTVAVAGATGYAGGEALRILAAHPAFEVTAVAGHSSIGHRLGEYQPHIPQLADLIVEDTTPAVLDGRDRPRAASRSLRSLGGAA